jgi:hypothetical protein
MTFNLHRVYSIGIHPPKSVLNEIVHIQSTRNGSRRWEEFLRTKYQYAALVQCKRKLIPR